MSGQETQKSFVNWKAMTESRVTEILTSLKGVQVSKQLISSFSHYLRI